MDTSYWKAFSVVVVPILIFFFGLWYTSQYSETSSPSARPTQGQSPADSLGIEPPAETENREGPETEPQILADPHTLRVRDEVRKGLHQVYEDRYAVPDARGRVFLTRDEVERALKGHVEHADPRKRAALAEIHGRVEDRLKSSKMPPTCHEVQHANCRFLWCVHPLYSGSAAMSPLGTCFEPKDP